ncbi:MAG: hypothetical protein WBA67_00070 [Jannaschia sp.]
MSRVQNFLRDESGTATVEWVVLTAVTIGMAVATVNVIKSGTAVAGQQLDSSFSSGKDGAQPDVRVVHDMAFVGVVRHELGGFTLEEMNTVTAFIDDMRIYFDANPDLLSEPEEEMISDFDVALGLTWTDIGQPRPRGGVWTEEAVAALPGEFQALAYTN